MVVDACRYSPVTTSWILDYQRMKATGAVRGVAPVVVAGCVPVVMPSVVVVIGIVGLALDASDTATDDDVEDPSPLTLTAVWTTATS